ncbi:histone deacetylase HDT1-like [Ananas comosus]|uniref:Histone deacetylase HDT1-like n=1 Tax=Ananas comosus TaxID=4615 RepID=A0A6P5G2N4_ANACO|nr:histone deacetylase HDT1-like [Ananas comosus]
MSSFASLGEAKKDRGNESVPIYVKFSNQKLVLGTLSADKVPQISYDLVFEKEFQLSNSSKNASVYFLGYKTAIADDEEYPFNFAFDFLDSTLLSSSKPSDFGDTDSEDEDIPLGLSANGKAAKNNAAMVDATAAKPKVKIEEPDKASSKQAADDEEDDDESEDVSDDEDGDEAEDDSDDEDDGDSSDEEVEEVTPKKAKTGGKKRPAEPASRSEKKAKLVSPAGSRKTGGDGKVGGHTATPHPTKQVGKTLVSNKQQQTPKSVGSVTCKSCSKKFNSENALQAHTKAKHGAGKLVFELWRTFFEDSSNNLGQFLLAAI